MRDMLKLWRLASAGLFLCLGAEARAVIFYSSGNDHNTSSPGGGLPWDNVVEIRSNTGIAGSGVYLGNRYVLTAAHVGPTEVVRINATDFTLEPAAPIQIGTADMKLLRLAADPGLGFIQLNTSAALNSGSAFLVGYGVGRSSGSITGSSPVLWGDDTTAIKRWGTNSIDGSLPDVDSGAYVSNLLYTQFNTNGGSNEAALTLYDSGSALFRQTGSGWFLVGLGVSAPSPTYGYSTAQDQDYSNDNNYFIQISSYASGTDVLYGVSVPEPAAAHLLVLAASILLCRRRSMA